MALGAVGMGYQNTISNQIIHTDFLSPNLNGKVVHAPCNISGQVTHICMRRKQILRSRNAVFALSNQSDNPESIRRKQTQACTDGQSLISAGGSKISKDKQNVDVLASGLHSEEEISPKAERLNTQGSILDKLKAVQLHVLASEQWNGSRLTLCHKSYTESAINLIHYLALKCLDVEELKEDLSSLGLLNLENVNPYVHAGLTASINMLEKLNSISLNAKEDTNTAIPSRKSVNKENAGCIMKSMRKKASSRRDLLLGSLRDQRSTHIMVTVGQEATESDAFVTDLLKSGTTIVRINCAHGNPTVWSEIIRRVKKTSQMLEKPCRVLMDLAGPKLRTGKLPSGPCVLKISPKKNSIGKITLPAQVCLLHEGSESPPAHLSPDAVLYIDGDDFFSKLEVGDTVKFSDARGKNKTLKIVSKGHTFGGTGFIGEIATTTYVQSGTLLRIKGKKGKFSVGQIVDVPPLEQFVRLRIGDLLVISRDSSNEEHDDPNGARGGAHRITCNSGYLFDSVKTGDPIAFDDGKIWGVIQGNSTSEVIVSITHAGPNGTKLGSEKSINIPESNIQFEGLTSKDLMDLDFVAAHADMVGVSFLRNTCDIVVLRQELEKRKLGNMGIVLKIETKSGFENLPLMLLEAMKSPNPLGVMIARGDLAVECGWERLADMQEDILSICNAAHIPVIWATQVLESLVKSGVPTRAELTDVASGRRASCIMLNKGKHVVKAVSTLDVILNNNKTMKMNAELKPLLLSSRLFQ